MNFGRGLLVSGEVLLGHKLRTALSLSGVGIGAAALVLMVGAGQAAQEYALSKVRAQGTNLLVVQAGKFRSTGGRTMQVANFTTLKPADVHLLRRQLLGVTALSGVTQRRFTAVHEKNRTSTTVSGAEPEMFDIRGIRAASGRLYTALEERNMARVAVLGPTAAKNLFGEDDPVGRTVQINRVEWRVVGVAEARGQDATGDDQDDVMFVPLRSAMTRLMNVTNIQSILIQCDDESGMGAVAEQAAFLLRKAHRLREGKEDDFTIQDQRQLLADQAQTSAAFTTLVGGVAGASLLTGGVGILAVMLISVRERTREIGLRRALGARRSDIRVQFLMESGALAGVGGALGNAVGMGGTALTCRLAEWPLILPWNATFAAFFLCLAMGVTFGLYPAVKASRLEPATALHAA